VGIDRRHWLYSSIQQRTSVCQRYGSVWGQMIDKATILIQVKHISLSGN
jgi:hypothetical protein